MVRLAADGNPGAPGVLALFDIDDSLPQNNAEQRRTGVGRNQTDDLAPVRRLTAMAVEAMTVDEILKLPAVMSLVTAARAWGIGRSRAYVMDRDNELPFRTLPVGREKKVRKIDLLASLGLKPDGTPLENETMVTVSPAGLQ